MSRYCSVQYSRVFLGRHLGSKFTGNDQNGPTLVSVQTVIVCVAAIAGLNMQLCT